MVKYMIDIALSNLMGSRVKLERLGEWIRKTAGLERIGLVGHYIAS